VADKDAYRALFKVMGEAMGLTRGQQAQLLQFLDDVGGWEPADDNRLIPAGGSMGEALRKSSNDDYDTEWA
jgi:hypothetical protein